MTSPCTSEDRSSRIAERINQSRVLDKVRETFSVVLENVKFCEIPGEKDGSVCVCVCVCVCACVCSHPRSAVALLARCGVHPPVAAVAALPSLQNTRTRVFTQGQIQDLHVPGARRQQRVSAASQTTRADSPVRQRMTHGFYDIPYVHWH